MEFDVNFLAVIVATVAHQAIGFLWYGLLFAKTWMKAMGKTKEDFEGQGPDAAMAWGVLASLLSALSIALILTLVEDPEMADGIAVGAVAGLGIATATIFMQGIYEQRSHLLSFIFSGYQTLGLIAMGAIIGAWQ